MTDASRQTEDSQRPVGVIKQPHWLNPRRIRFWVIAVVVLYTLFGLLLVPLATKSRVIGLIEDDLGRSATIGEITFNPYEFILTVRGFEMGDRDGARFAAFDQFSVDFQLSSLFRRVWTFREIHLAGPYFRFERFADGDTRVSRLLADLAALESDDDGGSGAAETEESSWPLLIADLLVENGALDLADQAVSPAAAVAVRGLRLSAGDVSSQAGEPFYFELSGDLETGGDFELDGKLALGPELSLSGNIRTQDLPLALTEPYVRRSARILIESGTLHSRVEFALPAGGSFSAGGSLHVSGLEIRDAAEQHRLLGLQMADIDRFDLDLDGGKLHLSRLLFEQPYARIVIFEDLSTNLSGLAVEQEESGETATGDPFNLVIGGIRVDEGSMDFSDLSLPLPFATRIAALDGAISTIATDSAEPATIRLEGQVDEFGLARIDGAMNVFDPIHQTDITLEFRNLLMSSLSPYSIAFAGREIDEGKLDLDLRYAIDGGQLQGENDIVISDLVLGDKVDHPDAASLPLGLAVALLKDANGVIDIDLPIEGDVNDPEFKIGGIVWQAFAGLVTKVVTAPFALLGKLIGAGSEDIGQFQFLAGRADLTPPELEKIGQLEKALGQRPQLVLEISGVYDPAIDVPALKEARLNETLRKMMDADGSAPDSASVMLDVEIRHVLETLFSQRFRDIPLESVKMAHTAAPAEDPEGTPLLDGLAYSGDLRKRLLAAEFVDEQDLAELARDRAEAIKAAFLAGGQVDDGRVLIAGSKEIASEDGEWVTLELAVAPK